MPSLIPIKFDALSETDRKRLAKSLSNPDCKVFEETRSDLFFYIGRIALLLFFSLIQYGLLSKYYGNPLRDEVWKAPDNIIWYGIWILGIVYVLIAIWRRYALKKLFGFRPGRYVLPFALIDARWSTLKVYDLMQLSRLDATHMHTNGAYTKTSFVFGFEDAPNQTLYITNKTQAEIARQRFDNLRNAAHQAIDQRDAAAVLGFDPLFELRKNKWKQRGGMALEADSFFIRCVKHPFTLSVLSAAMLAPVVWAARNAAADRAMYLEAKRINSEQAYRAYVEHGRFYVDEMRAALPKIAFDEVVRKRSVAALRDLLRRYPNAGLKEPVAKEIHALYQKSLARFRDQAVQTDAALVAAMEKLLDIVEQRGNPYVSINFVRPTPTELVQLDDLLKKKENIPGVGRIIPAAAHFGDNSAAGREARIIAALQKAFQTIFPNDVLNLGPAGHGKRQLPALEIRYQIDPSGAIYTSEKRDRGFVGLVMRFQSAIVVSETDEQWRFNLEVEPPQRFNVQYKGSNHGMDAGPEDSQVYAVMAERAFDTLESKILAAFFKPDSQAVMRQVKQAERRTQAEK